MRPVVVDSFGLDDVAIVVDAVHMGSAAFSILSVVVRNLSGVTAGSLCSVVGRGFGRRSSEGLVLR